MSGTTVDAAVGVGLFFAAVALLRLFGVSLLAAFGWLGARLSDRGRKRVEAHYRDDPESPSFSMRLGRIRPGPTGQWLRTTEVQKEPKCAVCGHEAHRDKPCCVCPYYSPVKP